MSGLFSTLNTGVRGLTTQQGAIDVTNHNVANANTDGYTRQRAQIVATRPEGMPSMNNAVSAGQLGTGSEINKINRVRDEFVDYQVRQANSVYGENLVQQKAFSEIEGAFDEPSEDALSKDFTTFFGNWSELSTTPESSSARTVVIEQAATVANDIRSTYKNISDIKNNTDGLIQSTVFSVNQKLNDLDQINQQIRRVTQAGETANDLLDKRDVLLDDLSQEFGITIDKDDYSSINLLAIDDGGKAPSGGTVYQPKLINATDTKDEKRLSYVNTITQAKDSDGHDIAGCYEVSYYENGDKTGAHTLKSIKVNMSASEKEELENNRVIVTDLDGNAIKNTDGSALSGTVSYSDLYVFKPRTGELKGYSEIKGNVDKYLTKLNNVAKALAWAVNAVESGSDKIDDGKKTPPIFVNNSKAEYDTTSGKDVLKAGYYADTTAEDAITAENISVNKELIEDPMKIKVNKGTNADGKGDGKVATAVSDIKDALLMVQNIGGSINTRKDLVNGKGFDSDGRLNNNADGTTVPKFLKDLVDALGTQSQSATSQVNHQKSLLNIFEQNRASTSGVSLDEEMSNLIQYQHAYSASAKIISTVDELLDVVVNGLKK